MSRPILSVLLVLLLLTAACGEHVPVEGIIIAKEHHNGHFTVSYGFDANGDITMKTGYDPDRWWFVVHILDGENRGIRVSDDTFAAYDVGDFFSEKG